MKKYSRILLVDGSTINVEMSIEEISREIGNRIHSLVAPFMTLGTTIFNTDNICAVVEVEEKSLIKRREK